MNNTFSHLKKKAVNVWMLGSLDFTERSCISDPTQKFVPYNFKRPKPPLNEP